MAYSQVRLCRKTPFSLFAKLHPLYFPGIAVFTVVFFGRSVSQHSVLLARQAGGGGVHCSAGGLSIVVSTIRHSGEDRDTTRP
jgi:hypothetical protein